MVILLSVFFVEPLTKKKETVPDDTLHHGDSRPELTSRLNTNVFF